MALTRETYVTQSVTEFLRRVLFEEKEFSTDAVEIIPSFPHTRFEDKALDKTYVAAGFNFDDPGREAEMGSTLKRRIYTIQFFVIGLTASWGENVANAVKFCLEQDGIIPLLDITSEGKPQIDSLVVTGVSAEHQPINNPKPWQENIWTVHLRVEDTYDSRLAIS